MKEKQLILSCFGWVATLIPTIITLNSTIFSAEKSHFYQWYHQEGQLLFSIILKAVILSVIGLFSFIIVMILKNQWTQEINGLNPFEKGIEEKSSVIEKDYHHRFGEKKKRVSEKHNYIRAKSNISTSYLNQLRKEALKNDAI